MFVGSLYTTLSEQCLHTIDVKTKFHGVSKSPKFSQLIKKQSRVLTPTNLFDCKAQGFPTTPDLQVLPLLQDWD